MFKETDLFHQPLDRPLPGFHAAHQTEPCSCCSPVFQQLSAADWDPLTDPDHWNNRGAMRQIYSPVASVVLINAKVLTMDDDFTEASSVSFKDGRIIAVGDEKSVRETSGPDAEVIDCGGRTILPGFIEPHFHFFPCASLERFENVGPFRFETVQEAIDQLKKLAEAAQPDEWIMGRQFDPSLQDGPPGGSLPGPQDRTRGTEPTSLVAFPRSLQRRPRSQGTGPRAARSLGGGGF